MLKMQQIHSQLQQLLLFYKFLPFRRIIEHTLFFPYDYCVSRGSAHFPLAINFLVTSACNLKCEMCSYSTLLKPLPDNELTTREIIDFFKREHKKGFHVFLSGGEPFMRSDILEIIAAIKNLKLSCGICTNGILLDE